MTLAKAALNSFSRINCPERKIISNIFFNKWKNNSVVLDSWFSFNASIEIDDKTKAIYVESMGNPRFNIPDFEGLSALAKENGIPLIVESN